MLVQGELTQTVLTADLGRLLALEGCLAGNVPDNKQGLGEPAARVPRDRGAPPGEGRVRAGHVHQHGGQPDQRRARAAGSRRRRRRRQQAAEAARRLSKRRGDSAGRAGAARATRPPGRARASSSHDISSWRSATASPACRAIDDPSFVSALVFDRTARRAGRAEVALRVPVPVEERRADPDPARPDLTDAQRQRAIDLIGTATGEKAFKPAQGRALRRDRRAGGGGRAGRRGAELDLRAAGRGAAADGGHAGARLPRAACGCCRWRWRSPRRP